MGVGGDGGKGDGRRGEKMTRKERKGEGTRADKVREVGKERNDEMKGKNEIRGKRRGKMR